MKYSVEADLWYVNIYSEYDINVNYNYTHFDIYFESLIWLNS
jgi:hypothetical protein